MWRQFLSLEVPSDRALPSEDRPGRTRCPHTAATKTPVSRSWPSDYKHRAPYASRSSRDDGELCRSPARGRPRHRGGRDGSPRQDDLQQSHRGELMASHAQRLVFPRERTMLYSSRELGPMKLDTANGIVRLTPTRLNSRFTLAHESRRNW